MPERVYLDDSGNPVGGAAVYLDDRGNPIGGKTQAAPKQDDGPDHGRLTPRQMLWRMGLGAENFGGSVKRNPGATGSIALTTLAAPFTGGMSLLPALATMGGLGAAGEGLGEAASGRVPSPTNMAKAGAMSVVGEGVGRGIGAGLRFVGGKLRGVKAPAEPPPAGPPASTAPAAFTGTGAVPMAGASQAAPSRAGMFRMMVDAPPTATAAPLRPTNARLVTDSARPAAAPPNTNVQKAVEEALTELRAAPPAAAAGRPGGLERRAVPRAADAAEDALYERMRAKMAKGEQTGSAANRELGQRKSQLESFREQQAQTRGAVEPRVSGAPVGLSDDVPMWGRAEVPPPSQAGEMRRALGAENAGAQLGMAADDVRAAAGGPSRRPMVAELADLDRDYMRHVMDPKGSIDFRLLLQLGKQLGLPGVGGAVGGVPGAILGAALGNPKVTGNVLYQAGRAPYNDLFRTALLSQLEQDQ